MSVTTKRKWHLAEDIALESLTVLVDSREQRPWDLAPMRTAAGTLQAGDYSILGWESRVAIERKSLPDLIGCCGRERDRFERELQRLHAYQLSCVIVEADWSEIQAGQWRSRLTPKQVIGAVTSWMAKGTPFVFAGDAKSAGDVCSRMLWHFAKHRVRELRSVLTLAEGESP